ncbi:MAG: nuclease-related domain-containing protein [Bhargavaea sp.]
MGKRNIPERLAALAVLESRVSDRHPAYERIRADLEMRLAGYAGEKKADFYLEEARLKEKPVVLKDVMIPSGGKQVQVDTLVLHPAFVLVLEVKNMTGELYFDDATGQFYRVINGVREGMRNPEDQLNRAVTATERFLASIELPVRVHGAIVLASYNGLVAKGPVSRPIFPVDRLPGHVEKLEEENRAVLKRRDIQFVIDALNLLDREKQDQYFKWYKLEKLDVKQGVRCPTCFNVGMERGHGRWICKNCDIQSHDAHLAALQEYRLLYGEHITVKAMMSFLCLNSKQATLRLCSTIGLRDHEKKRYKVFTIPKRLDLLNPLVNAKLYK